PGSALGEVFFGPDGAPALVEWDAELGDVAARPEVALARELGAASGCRASPGGKLLECHAVRTFVGADGRRGFVHVQDSSRRAIRALYDLRYQLIKLTLLVLPGAIALGWWLGWRMIRPLERLRAQALRQVEALAPGEGLVLARRDEFGELAAAMNRLIVEIRERARAHEAALVDLGHELKGPVAAIRASADALAAQPLRAAAPGDDATAGDERTDRLSAVLREASGRLELQLHQFLELARAEAGMVGEARERVDLGALVRGVVDSIAGDVRFATIRFAVEITSDDTAIDGVPARLETAVRNLVENAASFANASVCARVRGEQDALIVEVEDDGPGIAAADLPRVFERFYSKRSTGRGTGLGLALVRAIAEAHGGQATAASRPGEGARIVIALPRRATNDATPP
ncbi:MAG TPA: HAMP domain-containing sensor histidine kinase, partial [Nannocystaceae bacterium]|nr:HAMP domain-containing sensor histidine kinase [Nannocystaceae bacterium]